MTKQYKHLLINVAKVLTTLVLLTIVALTVDLRQVWEVVRQASWLYLLLAWALYQVGIFIRSFRWQELLRANGVHIRFSRLVSLYYVGTFFNNFLPTGFGGDVVKMYELSRAGADGELAISTVLADRMIGLAALFVMALCTLPFSFRLVPLPLVLILLAIILGFSAAIGLLLNPALAAHIAERFRPARRVLEHPGVAKFYNSFKRYTFYSLRKAIVASLFFNLTLIAVYVFLGLAVNVHISVVYFFIFIPIISSVMVLPISVSGLGVREGGYVLLFSQAGVAKPQALAMSLLFYALNLVTGIAGGIIYLVWTLRSAKLGETVAR